MAYARALGQTLWHQCDVWCSSFLFEPTSPSQGSLPASLSLPVFSSFWTSFRGKLWSMCIGLPGICGHHVEWHKFQVPFCHFFFPCPSFPCLSGHGLQVSQGENFITSSYTAELTVGLLHSSLSESDPASDLGLCLDCYMLYPKSTTPALYKLADLQEGFNNWCLDIDFSSRWSFFFGGDRLERGQSYVSCHCIVLFYSQ